jgi:phenylalanyl-tRNA synthetase beta chain
VRENKSLPLPIRIFEASDVAVQDASQERKSRNIRKVAGVWCNKTAGFEVVHGLLDRIMQILGVPFIEREESEAKTGYYIKETSSAYISSFLIVPSNGRGCFVAALLIAPPSLP